MRRQSSTPSGWRRSRHCRHSAAPSRRSSSAQVATANGSSAHRLERVGDEVARGHQRRQPAELALDRGDAAPLVGLVEDVVDDQRHVVHQLDREGELDRLGCRRAVHGAVAGEQRQRAEVLRRPGERPGERVAQLVVDAVAASRDPLAQQLDLGRRPERAR